MDKTGWDVEGAKALLAQMTGKPLEARAERAVKDGAARMAAAIAADAPEGGDYWSGGSPGALRRAIVGVDLGDLSAGVGRAPHQGLVSEGHEVWVHGTPTGIRTEGNSFVSQAIEATLDDVERDVADTLLDLG